MAKKQLNGIITNFETSENLSLGFQMNLPNQSLEQESWSADGLKLKAEKQRERKISLN